ncbi:hypothetical protein A5733_14070 [Mycobacterium sp. NS-7484]|uniref:hypothetical protein n=1 Tax=Mycobacterium sp. NS-7484 TaxID=1834161 RepID=UPI00096C4D19|nr:hypothetical protein [Mycobacterium sp. NS-7484]OMB94303.1 hypothetical protein A5733_14070 [Mycobacterium sp. NS-7484]
MNAKRLSAALGAVAVMLLAACSTTTTGVATAPDDVTPFTTTSKAPSRTKTPTTRAAPGGGSASLPPAAYAEVRAAGIEGSDSAIRNQLIMACIMGNGSFNKTKQDVVDVLTQMGSKLPPDALMTIVNVAIKYECPDLAGKLGG